MQLYPVTSKELHVIAVAHELISSPEAVNVAYALYSEGLSKTLYLGYFLEKEDCWWDTFKCVALKECSRKCSVKATKLSEEIHVHNWDRIQTLLVALSRLTRITYDQLKGDLISLLNKVFGFRNYFERIYVILSFNPLPARGLYGSLIHYDTLNALVTVFANEFTTPQEIVDLLLHEILHGLWRTNEVGLPDELEEKVIDALCPEGFLSKELSLSFTLRLKENDIVKAIKKYFTDKHYLKETLPKYLNNNIPSQNA